MQKLLDRLLQQGLEEGCYPGAVAAVGDANSVWAVSAVGVIAEGGPAVNRETRYDMASLTKVLAPTMIALRLIEEGKLGLYDTIGTFFPEAPEDKRDITVFQLMTHTAGFNPSFWLEKLAKDPDDAIRVLLEQPLDNPPGGAPSYSCMGYITLGKMIETLCGKPLNVLADEMVFQPLGMTRTGYCPVGGNIAATEICAETGVAWQGVVHDENARFLRGVSANAGVFSCIDDMIRFAQMLARGGDGFLTAAMMNRATRCYTPNADVHRGLGFHLAGTEYNFMGDLFPDCSFGHTGFTGTSLAVDPTTGRFAVLLSNRVHPTRENLKLMRFRRLFHNAVYAQAERR